MIDIKSRDQHLYDDNDVTCLKKLSQTGQLVYEWDTGHRKLGMDNEIFINVASPD